MSDLFFYGTLRHVPLLELVLGRPADHINLTQAELHGYGAYAVKDQIFPMVDKGEGRVTHGLLVQGLTPEDIDRLIVVKRAEADGVDIAARFDEVEVRIGDEPVPAGFGAFNLPAVAYNPRCATHFAGDVSNTAVTIECERPMSGRYMTFRNARRNHLSMDELYVHTL